MKLGVENPIDVTYPIKRSVAEPGLRMAIRTSRTERIEAITTIKNVNSKVAGILWPTNSLTGN
ncbi:unannotated protein [freshwater metagenome]|uniref:Unannotated protein n=1 Tax=freshwater metagenome TaxID=449393 RepID=A0A6J6TPJ0_9ZZZZ